MAVIARELSQDGGGHERASGCILKGSFQEIEKKAISQIKKSLKLD